MRRTSIVAFAVVICVVLFTGCGTSTPVQSSSNSTAGVSAETTVQSDPSDTEDDGTADSVYEDDSAVIGTYVGLNGSVLTFFPDHTADYYYVSFDAPETDCPWSYENGVISWTSSSLYSTIYAVVHNGDMSDLSFVSDSLFWDDEEYVKIDSTPEELTAAQCNTLISKYTGSTEERNDTTDSVDDSTSVHPDENSSQEPSTKVTDENEDDEYPEASSDFQYDLAFKRELPAYTLYLLFDTTAGTYFYMPDDGTYPSDGSYTGAFSDGIEFTLDGVQAHAKYTNEDGRVLKVSYEDSGNSYNFEKIGTREAELVYNINKRRW